MAEGHGHGVSVPDGLCGGLSAGLRFHHAGAEVFAFSPEFWFASPRFVDFGEKPRDRFVNYNGRTNLCI